MKENKNNNNNNNKKRITVVTYTDLNRDKSLIYKENKNKSGIYRFNNLITGKSYVGSSINLGSRLSIYYSEKAMLAKVKTRTSIIYSALLKHGYSKFTLDIIEYCILSVLISREEYYIDVLKPEYNIKIAIRKSWIYLINNKFKVLKS
jgi:group I intron endonuclease